nr:ABC transporter permease [uncultured Carboxylicivirga sp.]
MSKVSLIIQREYLSRVRKKSFVVMSILGPILFGAMMVLPTWFSSMEDTNEKKVAIVDQTGRYASHIESTELIKFDWLQNRSQQQMSSEYKQEGYYAYLFIEDDLLLHPDAVTIYSENQITIDVKENIRRQLKRLVEDQKLTSYNISGLDAIIKEVNNVRIDVKTIKLGEDGSEKESSQVVTIIAAVVFAMLVYFFVLMYGTQVMRGVMEEKTNRIVEVIVSSVKPFQLMMGKIVGIAMVALTQFTIWVVLTIMLYFGISAFVFNGGHVPTRMDDQIENVQSINGADSQAEMTEFQKSFTDITTKIKAINLAGIIFAFVFYFIGGYFLYASLFAALGAALDSETDSQQFVMPVMMPLILSIYIAMAAFRNPTGDLAFWFSMIPFTSPIVMMARMPFEPPIWELAVSMIILIATFIFTTWFAGRIYRTGILMYGKKVSYGELWKWFRYSGK